MKRTKSPFYVRRTFILSLLSFVAVAALVSFGVSARRANRAAALRSISSKAASVVKPAAAANIQDKNPNGPNAFGFTATLTDNTASPVAPGSPINYTAVLSNTSSAGESATNVVYSGNVDNTTQLTGAVQVSPVTVNDPFGITVLGNVSIDSGAFSVLTNDYMGQNPTGTITAFSATSAQGGNVTVDADGTFTYDPPAGYEGADSFTYTLSNAAAGSVGTVSLTVSGMVWFIQNGAAACTTIPASPNPGGCGRLSNPFSSLAAFQALNNGTGNNPAVNDNIFVYEHASAYTGGVTLLGGQKFIGQDATDTLATISGLTTPSGSPTFPTMNTGAPATTLSGAGITLNSTTTSNVVRGMTIQDTAANTKINGTNFGTLTVGKLGSTDVTLSGTGKALNLTTGTFAATSAFTSVASTSSATQGISITSVGGTVAFGSTTTSSSTNQGILVNTSSVNINFGNTAVTTAGGTGVNLTTNTGTLTFADLDITANASQRALHATNNTGAITTTSGTISAPSGIAVEIVGTAVGNKTPLNMQLTSVSASSAANGIVLTNMSATGSPGGFTVAGTGSAGTGGTIQTITNSGIQATDAASISLSWMNLTNANTADGGAAGGTCDSAVVSGCFGAIDLTNVTGVTLSRLVINDGEEQGIVGSNVTGFSISNSTVQNVGDDAGESGLNFLNLYGTVSITSSTFTGNAVSHVSVLNDTAGTPLNMTVTGSSFSSNSSIGGDGIVIDTRGGTTSRVLVDANTFSANRDDHFNMVSSSNAISDLTFSDNNLTGGHATPTGQGIAVRVGGPFTGTFTFDIDNNNVNGSIPTAINTGFGSTTSPGIMRGTIRNNDVGTSGSNLSGSAQGSCILVEENGTGNGRYNSLVTNNILRQCFDKGIDILASRDGISTGANMDVTVTNNNVSELTNASSRWAIRFETGSSVGTETGSSCVDILNNTLLAVTQIDEMSIRQRSNTPVSLPGYVGGANNDVNVQNYLQARNAAGGTATVTHTLATNFLNGGAQCIQPPLPTLPSAMAPPAGDVALRQKTSGSANTVAYVGAQFTTPAGMTASTKSMPAFSSGNHEGSNRAARRSHHPQFNRSRSMKASAVDKQPNLPTFGEPVGPITIPTLQAGKSVTIKYTATVIAPPTARQASHQVNVTYTGGTGSTLTDDPDAVGAANPTVTLIDTLSTWTGALNTNWNDPSNWTPTTYAPGVSNPAVNDVVIPGGVLPNEPTIGAAMPDITIFSLNIAAGRTLTIDPLPRALTIGAPAPGVGGDLTLNGSITGGELRFGTGSHVMTVGTGSLSSTNLARVLSGSSVVLNNTLQAGALAVNSGGSMDITSRTLSLNGAGGLSVPSGGLTTTGSTVIFNGAVTQSAAGVAYNNLTINNTAAGAPNALGVTLTGHATVNGALALTSNDLNTSTFTLTQPNTTASTGVSDVVGTIARTAAFGTTTITFGNPNNQITFTAAGTKPSTMTVTMAKAAPISYTSAVQRNYDISATGGSGYTATLRLRYLDSELNGNSETPDVDFNLRKGPLWKAVVPTARSTVDPTAGWLEASGQTSFSQWTFANLTPTASGGTVTGRIVDDNGAPVEGAVVRLSGAQNRKFITDANGVYRFENVETGGFYNVTPSRVNYTFSPAVISFSQLGETTEAAFGATATGTNINPLDTPEYFVRQNYLDFLGREPDESGFNFWSDQILGCGDDTDCVDHKRTHVSAAYFLSIEFQETGGLVDGLYRASFGRRPSYSEFKPDAAAVAPALVVGADGWATMLENGKAAFVDAFVQRAAFRTAYDGLASSDFVDALIANTGVSFTTAERDALVSGLGGGMTRAAVLRAIVEDADVVAAKRNQAFVMMEYFGYLRREPDAGGYQYWLDKLNQFNGNFEQAEMVRAFIVSQEYRERFPR